MVYSMSSHSGFAFRLQVAPLHLVRTRRPSLRPHSCLRWQRVTGIDGNQTAPTGLEPLLSVDEVAGLLHISERGVYRLIGRRELISVKVGGRTLFEPAAVQAFIAGCRRHAGAEKRDLDDSRNQEAA